MSGAEDRHQLHRDQSFVRWARAELERMRFRHDTLSDAEIETFVRLAMYFLAIRWTGAPTEAIKAALDRSFPE